VKSLAIIISGAWFVLAVALSAAAQEARPAAQQQEVKPTAEAQAVAPLEQKQEEKKAEAVEPLSIRPLVKIERNRNDSNPTWTPSGHLIAFERSKGDKKEILISRPDGTVLQTIYYQLSEDKGEMKFFFPGVYEEISYNAGINWSPAGDRFVFMSNGGEGNYDIYLRELGGKATTRLTDHKEKDGQAHWSPVADTIVFVSGRTGKGDIYLMDLATRGLTRLTQGGKPYLYPQWSPDGKRIAMMHGTNENHDIYLIADIAKPAESLKALTRWPHDDLRPIWSPDGKKIAFYSNYNAAGDPKVWAIAVIAADGTDPTQGEGLAAKVVAEDVVPDVERGLAWMPDSSRIVYVKNDKHEYNPIYIVDVRDRTNAPIRTETKMNHDVSIAVDGTIAFRAQVDQWDQIYVMKLK
jgi:Tol biopolymer transport system component